MSKNLEDRIKQYLVERGWDNLRPADMAKSVSIEAAELMKQSGSAAEPGTDSVYLKIKREHRQRATG